MQKEKITIREFYETYWLANNKIPPRRDVNGAFMERFIEAVESGAQGFHSTRTRGFNHDAYNSSLIMIGLELINEGDVVFISDNCDKFVADLKDKCGLDVIATKQEYGGTLASHKTIYDGIRYNNYSSFKLKLAEPFDDYSDWEHYIKVTSAIIVLGLISMAILYLKTCTP